MESITKEVIDFVDFILFEMVKSAGFLKKLKKIGQLIGKGAGWVNENVVKPLKPLINQGVNFAAGAAGVPMLGTAINSAIDAGSSWLDSNFGGQENKQIKDFTRYGVDRIMDTQRAPPERKYDNPFTQRLNFA